MINNLLIATRREGKTLKLIEKCSETPGSIIVCPTLSQCQNVFHMALERRKKIPMPITFTDFINGKWRGKGEHITAFYFDELNQVLEGYAKGVPIEIAVFDVTYTTVRRFVSDKDKKVD